MTLVDTSVWLDHLDSGVAALQTLLADGEVQMHPYVTGEIAMGNWKLRSITLTQLKKLPVVVTARHEEVLQFVEEQKLYGSGIGYIDAHLLASSKITPGCAFWTRDKRLRSAAVKLGIASPLI